MEGKPKACGIDDPGFIDALNASVQTLQQGIDMHCCLVNAIIGKQADADDLKTFFRQCPKRSRETALKDALTEAIHVLEESRKAFKSKRLEALRKHLTQVLIDTD